ncbi:MAG TPA: class I tRNA ligase family protein, partial [Candidatus Paceibacterota bacterium]|nr:class I tRNA ligase family protein [Candidatus Paceibacterota bacterium]
MLTENEESQKSDVAKREEEVLTFWRENQIFEKSLTKDSPNGEFVFYDGPPFATGLPHYGHLLAGTMKDVIPRFKTMKGFHVRRRWGWDCHGLPVENLVEKELGLKNKKDIEDFGIDSFNEKARESVLRYADEWKRIVPRMGRFVDMEDDYRTMDSTYTETVWWVFKTLYDRGLIYEGYKSMHICPRCETTLSNFEVTQGYKDVTDISVTVKFELVDEPGTYLLAWTTTPWTLPGNVALAVSKEIVYCQVKSQRPKAKDEAQNRGEGEGVLIVAKDRLAEVFKDAEYKLEKEFLGADLIGKKYKPVFDNYKDLPLKDVKGKDIAGVAKVWQIVEADFVTTESGTGIVHIAPAFGEDDYQLALKEGLPFIQHVNMSGEFKSEMGELAGQKVKPIESPQAADIEIIKLLATRNLLFSKEKITHAYPHCWRCATPLLNYAASSWFVKVTDLKEKLLEANQGIGWVPAHFREGRFGKWLSGARDWAISRSRFWGAPLPVWRCEACNQTEVVGSLTNLIKLQQGRNNTFTFMRHGQAESNLRDAISIDPNGPNHLTEQGKEEVRLSAQKLKEKKIDMIVSSDFVRTKETAELLAEELGLSEDEVVFDERLRELNTGNFLGKTWAEYDSQVGPLRKRFERQPEKGGENYNMVRRRMMALVYDLNEKYKNKNFLIVSHGLPLFLATATMRHLSLAEMEKEKGFATGEVRE